MLPKISIIIPVYNGENCIVNCLQSVYSLPIEENSFELIVIDDCSTDNTLEILNDYASKHSNMVVLHQEVNLRQGAARNRGIDIAKGEYIAFCDADDTIVADGVMNALKAVEKSHVDVCYFEMEYQNGKDNGWHLVEMPYATHNVIISSKTYLENYYTCYYNGPVRCLYRAEFLKSTNIRFVEGVRWEDCDWTVKVYAQAKTIQFVDGVGYRYAYNDNSTSRKRSPQAMSERVYAGLRLMNFGDEVRPKMPNLSKIISDEGKNYYVVDTIRLRNLTKYSFRQCVELYERIGEERRQALAEYTWPIWNSFFIKHKILSLFVLFFACPMARIGRTGVGLMRNKKKK